MGDLRILVSSTEKMSKVDWIKLPNFLRIFKPINGQIIYFGKFYCGNLVCFVCLLKNILSKNRKKNTILFKSSNCLIAHSEPSDSNALKILSISFPPNNLWKNNNKITFNINRNLDNNISQATYGKSKIHCIVSRSKRPFS